MRRPWSNLREVPGFMERTYQVGVPPGVARERWHDFEHELDFPGEHLHVRLEPIDDEPGRTRVCIAGEDDRAGERMDDAMRRFRLFLQSRGVIELLNPRAPR